MVRVFQDRGFTIITGGTDNHLWLTDMRNKDLTGTEAQEMLEAAGLIGNKNTIPHDPAGPFKPSGIRLGTPALTTRGFTAEESTRLAECMCDILNKKKANTKLIKKLIADHPMPTTR